MKQDEHRPQPTVAPAPVAKRAAGDEPRCEVMQNASPTKRKAGQVRHERGRAGYALADR
jgi:hypothetical protein